MSFLIDFIPREVSSWISIIAVMISVMSFGLSLKAYLSFAKNEFVKKQIQVVIDLVYVLHEDFFELRFMNYFVSQSAYANTYRTNVFEITDLKITDRYEDFFESQIHFSKNCNQLLNVKRFIYNPLLPKSIADELENFYSKVHCDIPYSQLEGTKLIVIESKHFEEGIFQERKEGVIKRPSAFALRNYENLVTCCGNLEKAIINWLKKHKVKEINIRKILD